MTSGPPVAKQKGPVFSTPQSCSKNFDPSRRTNRQRSRLRMSKRAYPYPMSKDLQLRNEVQNTKRRDQRKSNQLKIHDEVGQESAKNSVQILIFAQFLAVIAGRNAAAADSERASDPPLTPCQKLSNFAVKYRTPKQQIS